MSIARKSLLYIMNNETDPYKVKVLYEIQQICKELGIATNEAHCIGCYIQLIGRNKYDMIKYEAHIERLEPAMYRVYFSAFHDKPLPIGVMIGYDLNGNPFVKDTFD